MRHPGRVPARPPACPSARTPFRNIGIQARSTVQYVRLLCLPRLFQLPELLHQVPRAQEEGIVRFVSWWTSSPRPLVELLTVTDKGALCQ